MRDLGPFTTSPPYITPADDLARRLDGLPLNSTTSAELFRYVAGRIGTAAATRFFETTAKHKGNVK